MGTSNPRSWARPAALLLIPVLMFAACNRGGGSQSEAGSALTLKAGVNDPNDKTIAILTFLPESITIKTGTTVQWTIAGPEPHTVTFPALGQQPPSPDAAGAIDPKPPTGAYDGTTLVSSGLGPTGPDPIRFKLKFSKAGTYKYFCVIHPNMTGTVTVASSGKTDEKKDIVQRGRGEVTKYLAEGRAAKRALLAKAPKSQRNSNGTTTWFVEMGASTAHTQVFAFQPTPSNVKARDRVVFVNNTTAPHTASFAGATTLPTNPFSPEAMKAAPGGSPQTLDARDFFNTGWLPPNTPGGPPESARSFTFVIPKAGTFAYVCLLHQPSGHEGTIVAV